MKSRILRPNRPDPRVSEEDWKAPCMPIVYVPTAEHQNYAAVLAPSGQAKQLSCALGIALGYRTTMFARAQF